MKFLLIGGKRSSEIVNKYLIEEAKKVFDSVLFAPLDKIRIKYKNEKVDVFFKEKALSEFDAAYIRIFSEDIPFGEIIIDILKKNGVYIPTNAEAIHITNNKYYTSQTLSKIGIKVPSTIFAVSPKSIKKAGNVLGFPIVVKLISGFGGRGVMISRSEQEYIPILDTLQVFKELPCIQEFIPNPGTDVRGYVLGNRCITIRRTAPIGDFRSNVSRGGSAKIIKLGKEYENTAIKGARALGLEICAVDMLETKEGPIVVESNFTPGIIWKFFGRKFAKEIIKFIYERAKKIREGKEEYQ